MSVVPLNASSSLASQQELEKLLKQGRTHLLDLNTRLHQAATERDRLQVELTESRNARQRDIDQLEGQMGDIRAELQQITAERHQLVAQLGEQAAAHEQFARERANERTTFERLMDEASSKHREMAQELDEQRKQIDELREAAGRAQSFARDIIRAHETALVSSVKTPT
ncbi:MAG: hypothetical protein ABIS29_17535 [Vicinamibacterales bacterium]